MSKTDRDSKGLTQRQRDVTSLEIAWWYWLGNAEAPSLPHVCGWLRLADAGTIIDLIEQVSGNASVRSPRHVVIRNF